MSIAATARRVYNAIKENEDAVAQIRAEYTSLALTVATDPDAAFELTSSTVNGQTFSGKRDTTNSDRLDLLAKVVWMLDNGTPLPRTTRIVF